jgi:hypothetical protein
MQTISFKKRGFFYHLHKFLYKSDPEDTCTYRKELIIVGITCLFTLHVAIIKGILNLFPSIRNESNLHGIGFYAIFMAISLILTIMGVVVCEEIFPEYIYWSKLSLIDAYFASYLALFTGILVFILVLSSVAGAVGLIYFTCSYIDNHILNKIELPFIETIADKYNDILKREPETQIGVLYASLKEKWCKKIKWEN